jgi:hypothetical protein
VSNAINKGHPPVALLLAIVATVLLLALPFVASPDGTVVIPGRVYPTRVLLVAAALLAGFAHVRRPAERRRARLLVTAALVLVGFTAALVVRVVTPTASVLLAIAIGGLWWQRRALARTL